MRSSNGRPRVVITGMGAITPLGVTRPAFWEGLVEGRNGITRITQFDASPYECQIAGEVPNFDPTNYIDGKEARRMARSSQFSIAAAMEAWQNAGLNDAKLNRERLGVLFGTAIGGLDEADYGMQDFRGRGAARAKPFAITASIPNMSAYVVSREFQTLGPTSTIATACATGTQVIGEGSEFIRRGVADIVLAGGTEATIRDFAMAGFGGMRALPIHYNDAPEKASRPFDIDREGFVFSEGSGVVVLERLEHALARRATIYAEVLGHASSSDAFHVAQPDPDAAGAIRAMKWALEDAAVNFEDVDYINAHGSSTPINDPLETKAIKMLFGELAYEIPVSSTKSMIGHPMGASGTLEALACIMAIQTGVVHPTRNLDEPDPECDLNFVPNTAQEHRVKITLSNSFGLGGQNACLVLSEFNSR